MQRGPCCDSEISPILKELFNTRLGRFRLIAALEGISFLVLLGIAMPLKYIWHQPEMVRQVGLIHGLLFVLYILAILQNKIVLGWPAGKTALAMILSVVPFGTFYVTNRMIPKMESDVAGR